MVWKFTKYTIILFYFFDILILKATLCLLCTAMCSLILTKSHLNKRIGIVLIWVTHNTNKKKTSFRHSTINVTKFNSIDPIMNMEVVIWVLFNILKLGGSMYRLYTKYVLYKYLYNNIKSIFYHFFSYFNLYLNMSWSTRMKDQC